MKNRYLLGCILLSWLGCEQARAQYEFTDTNLHPYTQDFNSLTGNVAVTDNHLATLAEVYAQATFPGTTNTNFSPALIGPNDGSSSLAYYYHFGYGSGLANSEDRSFGGIAGTSYTANGIGYVGIRLKNSSSVTIRNLEVQYAMEQWYNSGRQDAAQLNVSYLVGSSATSLLEDAGAWVPVPALAVDAPSTATVIASRDGNSAANRRVRQTTIAGVNLAPGQEIMLRWAYTLNSATNGNGLSIDDVVVTPETNVYYSKTTGDLNDPANWDQSPWVAGQAAAATPPHNFTDDNQIFYVMSPGVTQTDINAERIQTGTGTSILTWTVSGANSKIVVGTPTTPATLRASYNRNIDGVIDLSPGSYFVHQQPTAPAFTFGSLATSSTVEYTSNGAKLTVQPGQYGNLTISGTATDRSVNPKTLGGPAIVAGTLRLTGNANLVLGNHDLTVLSSGSVSGGSATAYVVTNGQGRLRLQVPRAGTVAGPVVSFPVGSSVTSYTPATLQQTTATSDDVFEVRVLDGVSTSYSPSYLPIGAAVLSQVALKTWLISKEVPTNAANVTMTLQWNAGEHTGDFSSSTAFINHYTEGAWDGLNTESGATGTGPFVATRSNITSFSPFTVSSVPVVLPVELTSFQAQRAGAAVHCAWTTASEHNSQSFTVERSLDGRTFAALGQVPAVGNSPTAHAYAFTDAQPAPGLAYYRLRQTDLDGAEAFSPVVTVAGTAAAGESGAAPNPTLGPVTLVAGADITALEVLNTLGQVVLAQAGLEAAPSQPLDLSAQPAGLYLVRLHTALGTRLVRVVKR